MRPPPAALTEAAKLISRALLTTPTHHSTSTWTPTHEHTLHNLNLRHTITPPLIAQIIDPHLLNHHSLALGLFNWASQQPSFSHTPLTYQSILKSLSISRQFNSVQKLLKQTKTLKLVLHPTVYRSVIASQIIRRKTHTAYLTFKDIREMGIDIGHQVCNSLLAGLASDGYVEFATKVFDEMLLRGIYFTNIGFGVFVKRVCRGFKLEQTLGLIDEVKRKYDHNHNVCMINGSVMAVLIVDGLCRESRVWEASKVLEELRGRDWKPDFMAYRVVAEGFHVTGEFVEMEKVLKRKRKFGVAPRGKDYREFLLSLISERRIQEAKELAEVIVGGNFPIEEDVLNVLVGSVSAIDSDAAILFFKAMMEKGKFPSLLTLSNLSRNLCKNGKTDELLDVYRVLSSVDYFSDTESYNVMVSFLCTAGRVKEAYGVLQEMRKKGFDPDVSSYNSVMEACCREDLLRPAKKLWDEMFANGCRVNLKTYNILIQKFSETGDVEEARRLFNHMFDKGVAPDIVSYTSLLQGLCREAQVAAACEILKVSMKQDSMLAQSILTTLIHSLCKEGNSLAASKVIRVLLPDVKDHECHVVLLKGLADAGQIGVAFEHIEWVLKTSPSILQPVSAELVATLSSALNPEPVVQLIHAMMEKGLVSYDNAWMDLCHDLSFRKR